MNIVWISVKDKPVPRDGTTVLAYLEAQLHTTESRVTTATFYPNLHIIGGSYFDYDCPAVTHWADLTGCEPASPGEAS